MSQEIIVIVEPPPDIEVIVSDTSTSPEIDVVVTDTTAQSDIDVVISDTANSSDIDVVVSETGIVGPPGPPGSDGVGAPGPPGPPGPAGSIDNLYYEEFNVATPSETWLFAHNQNTYAISVETFDTGNQSIEGDVVYLDANNIQVNWYYPTAGVARLFR